MSWHGLTRSDGVRLVKAPSGAYVVVPPGPRRALRWCPCCDRPLDTASMARAAADRYLPPVGDPSSRESDSMTLDIRPRKRQRNG